MRALVSGAAGFIGTHLVMALTKTGVEVVMVDRKEGSRPPKDCNARFVAADLIDQTAICSALDGVDVVYHLAWSGLPRTSNENPNAHIALSLAPTLALLEACVKSSIKRIVFLSSGGAVYGQAIELPMTEEHPTRPLSVYGVTKLAAESYLEFYWRLYNLDYVILRPSVPYGESQNTSRGQGAVSAFLHSAIKREPITLWGGRGITRDFFYVGDLAKACLAAANESVKRGVYNIGGGKAITLGQLIDFIEELTNTKLIVINEPPRSFEPPSVLLDITKARRCLGWEPEVDIATGVERTWAWLKSLQ